MTLSSLVRPTSIASMPMDAKHGLHCSDAKALPPVSWPSEVADPTILLGAVPPLPTKLPKSDSLTGQPRSRIPNPEGGADKDTLGVLKQIWLGRDDPIECRVAPHRILRGARRSRPSPTTGAVAVLTMCWSYILSARLLQLQRRKMQYSEHCLQPQDAGKRRIPGKVTINLGGAVSDQLVTWICALLAPKPGWHPVDRGEYPPWAAFCGGDADCVIVTDAAMKCDFTGTPPSFVKATELLIEFCRLFGLGVVPAETAAQPLAPYTAAFYAALALPFGHFQGLRPQFPTPSLRRVNNHSYSFEPIDKYFDDLRYYMTLSIDPPAVGSVFWSIFWHPKIECNLVSPWLTSILDILKPAIDAGMSDILPKVFALRRPRAAPWWIGIFLLSDPAILGQITR